MLKTPAGYSRGGARAAFPVVARSGDTDWSSSRNMARSSHDPRFIMQRQLTESEALSRRLKGSEVSQVVIESQTRLRVQFSDGSILTASAGSDGLSVQVASAPPVDRNRAKRPTRRQFEYLAFIARYIQRFGRAPAEADIQRHFLVSAPSVNQMMQMLERRGFITREPGVARSTRLCLDVTTLDGV
jgi:LexA DNA binding domain